MAPYYIIVFISGCLCLLDFAKKNRYNNVILAVYAVFLVGFAGFRTVGVDRDSESYRLMFSYMEFLPWKDVIHSNSLYSMEVGYVFLNKLVYSLGLNFQFLLLLMEAATMGIYYHLITRYSPYKFLSFFLYVSMFYFIRDFTQIRFALAGALLMFALFRAQQNKNKQAFLFFFAAGLIHNSAWIGFAIWFAYKYIQGKYIYLLIPIAGFLIGKLNPINIILALIGLPAQIARYLEAEDDIGVSSMAALMSIILVYVCVLRNEKRFASHPSYRIFYVAQSASAAIGMMFITFPIMQRVSSILFTGLVWLMPQIISSFSLHKDKIIHLFIYLLFFSIFAYYSIGIINDLLKPYY